MHPLLASAMLFRPSIGFGIVSGVVEAALNGNGAQTGLAAAAGFMVAGNVGNLLRDAYRDGYMRTVFGMAVAGGIAAAVYTHDGVSETVSESLTNGNHQNNMVAETTYSYDMR